PIPQFFRTRGLPAPLVFETIPIDSFLPTDLSICSSTEVEIQSNTSYDSLRWSTGSELPKIEVTQAGIYFAELYKNGCTYRDTVEIHYDFEHQTIDTTICQGTEFLYKGQTYHVGDLVNDTLRALTSECDTVL